MRGDELPLAKIHANKLNPRRDLGGVSDLAASIESNGLLEPVDLAPCACGEIAGGHYRILDGHRRAKALRMLRRPALAPSEYKLHADITPSQEVALLVETNIRRKQYTPAETHEALVLKGRYGILKEAAVAAGTSYGSMRNFMSVMGRLVPELRQRVVWKRGPGETKGFSVTVREARELAQVGPHHQMALARARLSSSRLKAAVEMIKEGGGRTTPQEAIRRAKALEPGARTEDKTSAAFAAAYVTLLKRTVEVRDLVALGFSRTTAKRALKALELDGSVSGGAVSPALLEKLRSTTMTSRAGAADILGRLLGEGE
ncbi:MAG: ParB-like nuclease domain-containing protein [Nitrososphaerota archaeon]|nr:ParB-like nuclease domain-containing protein [Nitrososphaerota archaeon]